MLRTIIWYLYFWIYLVFLLPIYFKINKLFKEGKIKERDSLINKAATKWANNLLKLAGAKTTVIGAELVPKQGAVLFVCNHQGSFDIPLLLGCINKPKAFIAKVEMLKMPLISTLMKHLNCVFIDRNDMRQSLKELNKATGYLKDGYSMVLFPEGTRSKGADMGEFKAGGLKIAVKAGVPIVPVTIKGSYKLREQNKNFIKPASVEIIISEPIATNNLPKEQANGLNEKVKSIIAGNL